MPALMVQGCGSAVGKSLLAAGLCRLLANRGYAVSPFKPQNISNNAAVTADGAEIGRSTALQALACRTAPSPDMNPVLVKPQGQHSAQLIVRGKRAGVVGAGMQQQWKQPLLQVALACYQRLHERSDWVIVEGAGSPAETNLRAHDIANMGFAQAAGLPVVLVADIDRGHAIAALVGAHAVLGAADRACIKGFIINKFCGETSAFSTGLATIESYTGWPSLGIVPSISAVRCLPAEDALQLEHSVPAPREDRHGRVKIAVLHLPHIANFDEFDPLRAESAVELIFVPPGAPVPFDAALVILPGSTATLADLTFLRSQGWEHDLHAYVRRGGRVLGICAGYQMLGKAVRDPGRLENSAAAVAGLGLLDIETVMTQDKMLREVTGLETSTGARISGYEIHLGRCNGTGCAHPMVRFDDGSTDGAVAAAGRIAGCHVHGLFAATAFRAALLDQLGVASTQVDHCAQVDAALDQVAQTLEQCLHIESLLQIALA